MQRIEVVNERRRRFSTEEKLRILAEAECEGESLASTARRHGIARSLLQYWKKQLKTGAEKPALLGALPHTSALSADLVPDGFVRLLPSNETPTEETTDARILVHINAELIVEATNGVEVSRLAALVAALKR